MNYVFLILLLASPLWVFDLMLRVLHVAPPVWLGDSMAVALVLLGGGFIVSAIRGRGFSSAPPDQASETPGGTFQPADCAVAIPAAAFGFLPCLFHEIRNYSSTLRGNVQLLRSKAESPAILEYLGRLERTTDKIDSLSLKVLDAAAMARVTRYESIQVGNLIRECIRDHFPDRIETFRIQVEKIPPGVEGDPLKLECVFLNLFQNALDAGAGTVSVLLSRNHGSLRVLVEDDGKGCAADELGFLFQPLFTTKKAKGGIGLGLYLVKAILEAHGGRIRAVSKNLWGGKERGMIFCLELPQKLGAGIEKDQPMEWNALIGVRPVDP